MELYINDILVDLSKGVPFPLTYSISDIREIDKRKGNASKTIALPGTRKNSEIMTSVFSLTNTSKDFGGSPLSVSFDPSIKAPARYYDNGVLQFEGVCQLMNCSRKGDVWTFNIVLFSDVVDYIADLKKYKVNELGWDEYNHNLTRVNQTNSWDGIIQKNGVNYNNYSGVNWLGEGYYYGLIDYGYDRPGAEQFECDDIPPQVFVKSVIDKMFEKIGVTYTSTFFNSEQFKRLLVAYEGGILPNIDSATATAFSIETDQINESGGYIFEDTVLGFQEFNQGTPSGYFDFTGLQYQDYYLSNSATEIDPSSQIQTSDPLRFIASAEGDFVLTYDGTHEVNYDVTLVSGSGASIVYGVFVCKVYIIKNNIITQEAVLWQNTINSSSLTNSFTANFNTTFDLNLDYSDDIQIGLTLEITNSSVQDGSATSATLDLNVEAVSCELDIAYQVQIIQPGSTINVKQFLPSMTCQEFFKGLVNMFNLYMKHDPDNDKTVIIEPLTTFYNPSNDALNWSELVDYSKEFKVTPTLNLASKEYTFGFKDDKDYWNNRYFEDVTAQYGAKTLVNESQFAKDVTKTELPFSNKIIATIPTTSLKVPRNLQVKTSESGVSEITPKKGKPFIVQIKKGNVGTMQSGDWIHIDEFDTPYNETEYPYVGHLDDIDTPSFDLMFNLPSYVFYDLPVGVNYTTENLYDYHEKYLKEIVDKNGKMLTCYVRLNADLINKLDFANLINIDGVVYRLQKISNYDANKNTSTMCEFIRLIEGEGIQSYTIGDYPEDPYEVPSLNELRVTETNDQRQTEQGAEDRQLE